MLSTDDKSSGTYEEREYHGKQQYGAHIVMVAEANIGADDSDAAALQGMKVLWSQSVSHQRSISKRTKRLSWSL